MSELLFGVWGWPVAVASVLAGLAVGIEVLGPVLRHPSFSSRIASPASYATMVGVLAALTGLAFYAGQVAGAIADGDPLWWRVASRYTLWLLYSVALALGSWVSLVAHQRRRHRVAHQRAAAEKAREDGRRG